jgi:hypothetical protein
MSQRTIQSSVTQYLDGDADDFDSPDVARIKQRTPVDITTKIYIGNGVYHGYQQGGISGCPHSRWRQEPATIADAIERDIEPCHNCDPPDYRRTPDETSEITLALPDEKPTTVADLDPIVIAGGNESTNAHIAARGGDQPAPLCTVEGTYNARSKWKLKSASIYPNPNEWFDGVCSQCLLAYENVTKRGETA